MFLEHEAVGQPFTDYRLRFGLATLATLLGGGHKGLDGKQVAWSPADFLLPWERGNSGEQGASTAGDVDLPPEEDRLAPAALYRKQALSPEASVNAAMRALRGRVEQTRN